MDPTARVRPAVWFSLSPRDVGTGQQTLTGCLWLIFINAPGLPILFLPLQQFERRLEMIGEPAPLVGIEAVHQCHQFRMPEAIMAEELPHMRPVLLLAMRVVVLAVGPAARPGQLDPPPVEVPVQRPVEELGAVVGVEVFHRVGHDRFEFPQLYRHPRWRSCSRRRGSPSNR